MKNSNIQNNFKMMNWAKDLFPLCRSLTGSGNDQTFKYIIDNANKKLIDILLEIKVSTSKNEAKKLIQGNAVKINQQVVSDVFYGFNEPCEFELSVGKKKFFKIILL